MRVPRTPKIAGEAASIAPERLKRVKRHPEIEVAIGARIRTLRVAAGMSQSALGEVVGISHQQMQKYELGKDRVAASTLQGLAAALGVHPGTFFDEDAPPPSRTISDVRDVVKIGQRIQRVRDPAVVRRLLALVDALVGVDDKQPVATDGTP